MSKLSEGLVIKLKGYRRYWVVLNVDSDTLENTSIDTYTTGLHAFGGMWYGDDPMNGESYGKILYVEDESDHEILGHVSQFSLPKLKKMVG